MSAGWAALAAGLTTAVGAVIAVVRLRLLGALHNARTTDETDEAGA